MFLGNHIHLMPVKNFKKLLLRYTFFNLMGNSLSLSGLLSEIAFLDC